MRIFLPFEFNHGIPTFLFNLVETIPIETMCHFQPFPSKFNLKPIRLHI